MAYAMSTVTLICVYFTIQVSSNLTYRFNHFLQELTKAVQLFLLIFFRRDEKIWTKPKNYAGKFWHKTFQA